MVQLFYGTFVTERRHEGMSYFFFIGVVYDFQSSPGIYVIFFLR